MLGLGVLLIAAQLPAATQPAENSFSVPPQGFDRVREGIEKGKLERVEYDATAVSIGLKRWMEVYTPPGYSKDKKYPVLYLLHGIGGNENRECPQGRAWRTYSSIILLPTRRSSP
jgi:enterochelin esterase-like enzyme